MSDLTDAVQAIRNARAAYEKADDYYNGQIREVFASPSIRRRLERTGMAYRINLARRPVDAVLDRLELSSVTVTDNDDAAAWLAEQWERNEMDLEAPEVHRAASKFGDCYVLVWPADTDTDADDPADTDDDEGAGDVDVDMFVNSPLTTRVFYSMENPRVKSYAAKVWPQGEGLRATLYYPDRIERYFASDASTTTTPTDGDFEMYVDDAAETWPTPNPYGIVPVFHFRNLRPYGSPEHLDAYGPQDILTKLVVTMMSTVDFHGFPQRYALLGDTTDDLGGFDDDDETDNPSNNVSELRAGAGEVWSLRNVSAVGQFPAADVNNFLTPAAAAIRFMAATTATPLHYFEPMGDAPSGESLRAAEAPLIKRVEARQLSYVGTWRDVVSFALKIAGLDGMVDVRWSPTQTIDDLAGWQSVEAQRAAGVPLRQCLIEAGYPEDKVDVWLANNAEDDLKGRIDALAQLGVAVSGLSSGAAVGIVTHAQVTAIIDQFLALDAATEPELDGAT